MDWVRFFSRPYWDQRIVNEDGSFVPIFRNTKPLKSNATLAKQLASPFYATQGFSDLTVQGGTSISELFQEYVSGHVSFASAKSQFNTIVATAVKQYVATNHVHY